MVLEGGAVVVQRAGGRRHWSKGSGGEGSRRVGVWGKERGVQSKYEDPAAPPGKGRKPVPQEQRERGRQAGERLGRREPE